MWTLRATSAPLLAVVLLASPSVIAAQVTLELAPFAGGTFYLADPPDQFQIPRRNMNRLLVQNGAFSDAFTAGLTAGISFDERYSIEAMFSWAPTELKTTSFATRDVNTYMYSASFAYRFMSSGDRVRPYLGLGIGGETVDYDPVGWNTDTDFMSNILGGFMIGLTERTALRLEARDCLTWFDSDVPDIDDAVQNDLMITAGLSFAIPLGW